jgi:hypothetical protein
MNAANTMDDGTAENGEHNGYMATALMANAPGCSRRMPPRGRTGRDDIGEPNLPQRGN